MRETGREYATKHIYEGEQRLVFDVRVFYDLQWTLFYPYLSLSHTGPLTKI